MLRIIPGVMLAAAAVMSSSADAQAWGGYMGGGGYYQQGYGYGPRNLVQSVCSGRRAYSLERRLGEEEREGEIEGYQAARIHRSIDRLEDRQRHECAEGDWHGIARIGSEYDRIGQCIEAEAHGYRPWGR